MNELDLFFFRFINQTPIHAIPRRINDALTIGAQLTGFKKINEIIATMNHDAAKINIILPYSISLMQYSMIFLT